MANAEASSSKLPRSITVRRKSYDALRRATNGSLSTSNKDTQKGSSADGSKPSSILSDGGHRRVRAVPPSAAFEPPTPPTPANDSLPNVTPLHPRQETGNTATSQHKKRRIHHIRYDTSESSAGSTDVEDSEDEPPWWIFTHRGMSKMRERTIKRHHGVKESRPVSGVESGKDSAKEGPSVVESRRSSRDKENSATPASSIKKGRRKDINKLDPNTQNKPRLRQGSLQPSALLWRRSAGRDIDPIPLMLQPAPMIRSNSAPSSPIITANPHLPMPNPLSTVKSRREEVDGDLAVLSTPDRPVSKQRPIAMARRQFTAPTAPRFMRRSDQDIHTDTETAGATLPRAKQREKLQGVSTPRSSSLVGGNTEEGSSTPNRPKGRRMNTARLRIGLPDPITQHFAEGWQKGWPHAGTWQDAYYGYYSEQPSDSNPAAARKRPSSSRKNSESDAMVKNRQLTKSNQTDPIVNPNRSDRSLPTSPERKPRETVTRRKTRRTRRYRQALAPPTPSGLGFTPNGLERGNERWKEGRVGVEENGFDWGGGTHPTGRIDEGDELARGPGVVDEKSSQRESVKRKWWQLGKKRKMLQDGRVEPISWKKQMRRMLFLDARVTIYIRLFNLVIVVVSLALAIRIRLQLDQLLVPGLMGSSTTLLIAFSAFTMLHVLLAIYREYFGKPIGLWGLRSKMLWVCLDLAFIALWSSVVSLSINDHISTALECTPDVPWWRGGLSTSYALLLKHLHLSKTTTMDRLDITPVELITRSLGVVLPIEITGSRLAHEICDKQIGSIVLAFITLFLYTGNMVLSLFRIFETVRRTANVDRAVMV